MKHTREEIIQALTVIKDECSVYENSCCNYPFYNEDCDCAINKRTPQKWIITENKPIWRALK